MFINCQQRRISFTSLNSHQVTNNTDAVDQIFTKRRQLWQMASLMEIKIVMIYEVLDEIISTTIRLVHYRGKNQMSHKEKKVELIDTNLISFCRKRI